MKKRLLVGATAVSLLGVLVPGLAGAAPTPAYTVSCVVGLNTTADYSHVKLSQVKFEWFAGTATTFPSVTVTITRKAPNGFAFATTAPAGVDGVNPDRVVVSFTHADGSGPDRVEVPCV
jgi:hypothetical protein